MTARTSSRTDSFEPFLEVDNLSVSFGDFTAVDGVSLKVGAGERVAIVGESGSGKSVTAMSIAQLIGYQGGTVGPGSTILLDGRNLQTLTSDELRAIRGSQIGVVFQDHSGSLNPVMTVGAQISEALLLHDIVDNKSQARARAEELLDQVGIARPKERLDAYPHELSGGMRQRVLIASALAPSPKLLIADEPTTALDAVVQRQIVTLLRQLSDELGLSLLMISHDLRLVAGIADRTLVMHNGKIVESGPTRQIFHDPQDPYTKKLLSASPSIQDAPLSVGDTSAEPRANLLEVVDLDLTYSSMGVKAADRVSFTIKRGTSLGIVGESGSGKTTVARCVMRLIEADSGTVVLDGQDVTRLRRRGLRKLRRRMQMVFQDPRASLDPRMRVEQLLAEPFKVYGLWGKPGSDQARLIELLKLVGLQESDLRKYPREFSGGQLQRVAIARALALSPDLIVCDEAVSALDASIAAQIVDLLKDLQLQLGLTYLFIGHDLSLVRYFCDEVAVMTGGRIVEMGPSESLFDNPQHDYTKMLLAAQPSMAETWA